MRRPQQVPDLRLDEQLPGPAVVECRRLARQGPPSCVGAPSPAPLELVRSVLVVAPLMQDGIEYVAESAAAEIIREEDTYSGVRVHIEARLASARLRFHVDVNVGDPIWPSPRLVAVPRLRGGAPIELPGYPIYMVLAEKLVTAIQRGTANTRWRHFGDVWSLWRQHPATANDMA